MCPRSLPSIATSLTTLLLLASCARPSTSAPRGPERHAARDADIPEEHGPTHRAPPPEFGNEIVWSDDRPSSF